MSAPLDWLPEAALALQSDGLWRSRRCVTPLADGWCEFEGRRLKNFAGNDYLNLAHDPRVIAAMQNAVSTAGTGVTASALVSGRTPWHQRLEDELARFHGEESAVLFPTGYAANLGTIAALAGSDDVMFCDRMNHACLVDGCRLSGAKLRIYRHTELDRLAAELQKATDFQRKWIVTDSVFSMEGDLAPLNELCDLAEAHGASIILDEAHAFGLLGEQGRGAAELLGVESRIAVRIGTLSKALGALGGFVVGSRTLTDWLWNRARTQMFSTALPVPICAAAVAALGIVTSEPDRRQSAILLAEDLRSRLRDCGFDVPAGLGPIVPVILGSPEWTLDAAAHLATAGYLVAAIRPPTVPQRTSRLRITVSAACTEEDLKGLVAALVAWNPSGA